MSVVVAVRVRPFSEREKNMNSQLCVSMEGNETTLLNLQQPAKNKKFLYDYSFWSHDQYRETSDGKLEANNAYYVDQNQVYDILGKQILNNAWEGYHCTLFAYGQTGSGKSYSVMGYKPNIGIVPIACEEIFNRITNSVENSTIQYQVMFGMMEIYNEKVQDLFIHVHNRTQGGLKIRESNTMGFYAEGQTKYPVRSFQEIEQRISEGSHNRSIAATLMNAHSSRAHTIITIELKQIIQQGKIKIEKISHINLVDLAGSEKVGKSGTTGDRLKEATNINKSLTTLGIVIATLAEMEQKPSMKKQVPYRDSALTKILKNALGGNSKTIMICAISPADNNYDETLSTLRYAKQAKTIKNKAVINENQTAKIMKDLQHENLQLKLLIQQFQEKISKQPTLVTNQNPEEEDEQQPEEKGKKQIEQSKQFKKQQQIEDDHQKAQEELLSQLGQLQEKMNANKQLMDDQTTTYEAKIQELAQQKQNSVETKRMYQVDQSKPYLTNLNEDPQLNFQVSYQLEMEMVSAGRSKDADVQVKGLGIKPVHCHFMRDDKNDIYLSFNQDDVSTKDHLHLNGQKIQSQTKLCHNDRIIIGQNATFLVKIPGCKIREKTPSKEQLITWDFCQEEYLNQFKQFQEKEQEQIKEKIRDDAEEKIAVMEEIYQLQIDLLQKKIKEQETYYTSKFQEGVQNGLIDDSLQIDPNDKLINGHNIKDQQDLQLELQQNQQKRLKQLEKKKNKKSTISPEERLNYLLVTVMPRVESMNLIAEELERDIKFFIVQDDNDNILCKVVNKQKKTSYVWKFTTIMERFEEMLDYYDDYEESGELPDWDPSTDPFLERRSDKSGMNLNEYFKQQELENEQSEKHELNLNDSKGRYQNQNSLPDDRTIGINSVSQNPPQQKTASESESTPQSSLIKQFFFFCGFLIPFMFAFIQFDAFVIEQSKYNFDGGACAKTTNRDKGMTYFVSVTNFLMLMVQLFISSVQQIKKVKVKYYKYVNCLKIVILIASIVSHLVSAFSVKNCFKKSQFESFQTLIIINFSFLIVYQGFMMFELYIGDKYRKNQIFSALDSEVSEQTDNNLLPPLQQYNNQAVEQQSRIDQYSNYNYQQHHQNKLSIDIVPNSRISQDNTHRQLQKQSYRSYQQRSQFGSAQKQQRNSKNQTQTELLSQQQKNDELYARSLQNKYDKSTKNPSQKSTKTGKPPSYRNNVPLQYQDNQKEIVIISDRRK